MDPVCRMYKYLQAADIPVNSHKYIFRGIRFNKKSGKTQLKIVDKPVTYNTIREEIKLAIKNIGLDEKLYSTHSLRAGGATTAVDRGVPDRLLKIHGRWQSDDSKDRYVRDSIHHRLKVTLNLGL